MNKGMKPEYNALLQRYMDYRDEADRKELLAELNGNPSPTREELSGAINRITRRYFSKPRKVKRLKTPDFTFDTPNPSSEQLQAKLRDWARDPFNWEYVEVEGDKD